MTENQDCPQEDELLRRIYLDPIFLDPNNSEKYSDIDLSEAISVRVPVKTTFYTKKREELPLPKNLNDPDLTKILLDVFRNPDKYKDSFELIESEMLMEEEEEGAILNSLDFEPLNNPYLTEARKRGLEVVILLN